MISEHHHWRWQMENAIRRLEDLPRGMVSPGDWEGVNRATTRFPMVINPYYLSLIDREDPADPIKRMAVPSPRELLGSPHLAEDPIDEEALSPVPGLIHRYSDRCVLLVSGTCATNCRHCTRRGLGRGRLAPLNDASLERAVTYIREHREIRDVILSGGDPLLLDDGQVVRILERVRSIPSVEIIRIGTRVPVTLPMRISRELASNLARFHPLYINTQFNHPREVTAWAARGAAHLADAGIPLSNQAVLLRGVNDTPEEMEALCRELLRIRVRPYYLFLCDLWNGLEHFRTPLSTGVKILEHLRGRLSGLGIPQLVVDLRGGVGKVPILPEYIVRRDSGGTLLRSSGGKQVYYPDPEPL